MQHTAQQHTLLAALLLMLLAHQVCSVCVAPSTNWEMEYSSQDGVCLYTLVAAARSSYNYSQTLKQCQQATVNTGIARLVRVDSVTKKFNLFQFMLRRSIGYSRAWTEASCNVTGSKFQWADGGFVDVTATCSSVDARVLVELNIDQNREATFDFVTSSTGSEAYVPVCEYDVPQCDPSTVTGYTASRMQPSSVPYANTNVTLDCKPGFFRQLTGSAAEDTNRNRYYCTFTAGSGIGTVAFTAFSNAEPDACKPVHCVGQTLLNATVPNVNTSFKNAITSAQEFGFGESVGVACKPGYVNYADDTNVTSSFVCGQSDLDRSLGMWIPPSLVACFAIKCKQPIPFYDDTKMRAYKAYDRVKDRTYTEIETNRFPYYPNVVHLRCRQAGEFFMDRKYDKTVQCTLPNNGSNNLAVWQPVDGTVLNSAIMDCKKITCLTNEIVITSQQNDLLNYLTRGGINNTLHITDSNGVISNVTIKEFTEMSDLGFNYKVKFYCNTDHEMSVTNPETGRLDAVDKFEVACSSSGTWATRISACIKRTASLLTGNSKKYVPPAKEADGAQSLGVVVIVILIVFFSTILILDLTTITRDIGLMRKNIRRLKLKMKSKK